MTPARPAFVETLGDGLFAVDTGFHRDRYDTAWLVVDSGRAAFIDTGTAFAVPRLLEALSFAGLAPADVEYVIPTHVHLDHAGGVGRLMQQLPAATLVVHPRGARHMIDPTGLYAGALAVYGQETMDRDYGRLEPVPAARVRTTSDGESLRLGTRALAFAHTPGHALHHHCVWDERSSGWFTGDTFGMAFPEFRVDGRSFIIPSATPVQFDPEAMHASIDRLLAAAPRAMYLTHFGRVTDVAHCGDQLKAMLDATVAAARACRDAPDRHAALAADLLALYVAGARSNGVTLAEARLAQLLRDDAALNAAGLGIWLDRPARHPAAGLPHGPAV
jgi:glyoxylase-like metal-dependent hydrolase (beta-lactamase superfamily II)